MKTLALCLALLFSGSGLILAQAFDDWGEVRVLGLGQVESLQYSSDGSRLAVGGTGGVRYFDTDSYEMDTQLRGAGAVRSISWSPDGKGIVSMNQSPIGGAVKIWDAGTGGLIRTHQEMDLISAWQVAWSPDGRKIAAGFTRAYAEGLVRIWDAETGEEFKTILSGDDAAGAVAWSPDSTKIATSAAQSHDDIKIWDVETGMLVQRLRGHTWAIPSIQWSPDGSKIASGSLDTTVRIWDVERGTALRIYTLQPIDAVLSVRWSPDGSKLAAGTGGRLIKIWDMETGAELATLRGHESFVKSVAWSPDGSQLASGSVDDARVIIWDAESYEPLTAITLGHRHWVQSVRWSPDAKRVASASSDTTVIIWDAETGEEAVILSGHTDEVRSISWSPDDKRIASGSSDGTVKIWNAETGQVLKTLNHGGRVDAVSWSLDEGIIASGSPESVKIWDVASGRIIGTLPGARNPLSWSPDSRKIATGTVSRPNVITIWDVESSGELKTFNKHADTIAVIVWSPDGSKIASAQMSGGMRIWDAETGEEVWPSLAIPYYSVSWSPDSRKIALGSSEIRGVEIRDVESSELMRNLTGHGILVNTVNWSPDGSKVASGSFDLTVRIWGSDMRSPK